MKFQVLRAASSQASYFSVIFYFFIYSLAVIFSVAKTTHILPPVKGKNWASPCQNATLMLQNALPLPFLFLIWHDSFCRTSLSRKMLRIGWRRISKPAASALHVLHMVYAFTNQSLHKMSTADSSFCATCKTPEDVSHIMLSCADYTLHRQPLFSTL